LDGNFCLFVAKRSEALFDRNLYLCNMVTGKELTTGTADRATPAAGDKSGRQIEGHRVGFPVWFAAKLSGMMESKAPLGYEDESGFHWGADLAG